MHLLRLTDRIINLDELCHARYTPAKGTPFSSNLHYTLTDGFARDISGPAADAAWAYLCSLATHPLRVAIDAAPVTEKKG